MNKMKKKLLIIVIALMIIGSGAAWYSYEYIYNKPHPDYGELEADHSLDDNYLFEAFRTNTKKANETYTGKMIIVDGRIDKIETTGGTVTAVIVMDEGMFGDEGIRFTFLPEESQLAADLQPDSRARIKGFCAGYNETDVIMDKCSIVN